MPVAGPMIAQRPHIDYLAAEGLWLVVDDYVLDFNGYRFRIPRGFLSDLSSVPRELWSFIAPFELGIPAPLIHDWGYEHSGTYLLEVDPRVPDARTPFSQADVDELLRDIALADGAAQWRCTAAYDAVRQFGARDFGKPPEHTLAPPSITAAANAAWQGWAFAALGAGAAA